MPKDYITQLIEIGSTTGIAMAGGLGHNLYMIYKNKKVTWSIFFINIALAAFVGYVVGEALPPSGLTNATLAISGVSAIKIFEIFEEMGAEILFKKL